MANHKSQTPWNKGLKLPPMSQETRDKIGRANKGNGLGQTHPDRWITGPDPAMKRLRRRWLMAKNQAKYWSQEWHLSWEQYKEITWNTHWKQGITKESINLGRRDKSKGWTMDNVWMVNRKEQSHRPKVRDQHVNVVKRVVNKQENKDV